jgi:dynein heavy chain 2, cytosolic
VLTEYGYLNKVSKEILKINEEGKKILKEAVSLKQIANFYNTLSSQVISSQKPMLVQLAREFESNLMLLTERSKLKNQNQGQSIDLENFVNLVQNAANDLTKEIRKLKKSHSTILDLICQLLNYDLISNRNKWKEILKKSRAVFSEVADKYEDKNLIAEWSNHWNYQLYKVLKIQYSLSLEKFFQHVTEVDCEFIIQNKQLIITPAPEELKKSIYKEIKSFVSIPTLIKGFIETDESSSNGNSLPALSNDYYHNLISINSQSINNLYLKLNDSLTKLEDLRIQFSEIIGLSYIDFDTYISNNFTKLEDWKFNFEILRKKLREVEKYEDSIKIEPFKINLNSYKSFIEDLFEKIFEILSTTLKEKLKFKINQIDEFIKYGMNLMSEKPQTMQEILVFKSNYLELTRKKFEFKKICDECENMNKLLVMMSGQSLNTVTSLESRWYNFDSMMGSFSEMIEEQKQSIKKELNNKMGNFNLQLEKFYSKWEATRIPDNFMPDKDTNISEIANSIKSIHSEWNQHEKEIQAVIDECTNFELELPDLSIFNKIKLEINSNKSKWDLFFQFNKDLENLESEEWLSIRHKAYSMIQDLTMNWQDKLKKKEKDFIYFHISSQLEFYKQSLSVYKYLIGDNFERDHWKNLFNLLKFDNKITKENLKFGNFIEKTELLVKRANDIKDLYSRAQGEILIRNAMSELAAWFETAEFSFTEYINQNNNRKTPLIKEWKELMNEISEKQALLISVKSSEYFSRFSDQIEQFENKFSNLDVWLSNLNLIQRKWVYLEPIFSRGALPKEQSRFKKIDDEFRNIQLTLNSSIKVNAIFSIPGIKDTLEMLIDQLEKCQKALNDFLEDKRNKFARLYFLGDDDLLEFLAKSKDKSVIKNNLKKLYQGITNLQISESSGKLMITNMESSLGESVKLKDEVQIVDELEKWLNDLTIEMRNSLNFNLLEGIRKFGSSNNLEHLNIYSAQICGLIEMLNFTNLVESAIIKGSASNMSQVKEKVLQIISDLTLIQVKSGSNPIQLFKIKNLMLDMIHNREVIDFLINTKVSDINDWNWYSQLKYHIKDIKSSKNLQVAMCDGSFDYTFEYQGACPKLVHTPLTDKCYLTLTQALRLGYGGNPYGPAGTGKTESVKALGGAFGRQVLVFNCDEGIDFKAMGRIFIGLVKSGAWGCFDEFNRLLEEQLSAISIQIQIIQYALKNGIETCSLLNQNISVNSNSAIFVTLNPAGKGYGGRSKLPDNLKILFRPVAMSVPDNQQIAQTLLYAEGFKHAEILAQKVTALFTLCRQGLSNQQHYDWGLRALKTILTVANQQIGIFLMKGEKATFEDETEILIKAIRINVLSKLTFEDAINFNLLCEDVFPGIKLNDITYEEMNKALLESYTEMNYEFIDSQFKKVLQFFEACRQRMGVVLVGPSGCGKTAIWKLLKHAYSKLNQQVVVHIINPKSMPRSLLLGQMNHDTGEYTYGVLTKCAREVEKEPSNVKCWIICDGDVDPEWIEALNSVLDDNRLLTMQNGERINFGSNVNFIFETDSLKFASPATISRMGIIYMNQEDLDIKSIINSWCKRFKSKNEKNTSVASNLESWFENYFFEIYNSLTQNHELMLNTTHYGSINNLLSLLAEVDSRAKFTDSLIKGLGANLNLESRKKLAMEIYSITGDKPSNLTNPLNHYYDKNSNSLKEYTNQLVSDTENDLVDLKNFNSLKANPIVKTGSILRDMEIIKTWLESNEPFIVLGPEGCGKSLLINHTVNSLKSCGMSIVNCTSQTSAGNIIQKLLQCCVFSNTSKGRCLRPKETQKLILYLKDINLPKPDRYNTIQLISFLQQIVTYQGFYDENLEFIYLERIQIIASMNPPSTVGRYEITTRFTGNLRILYLDYPSIEDMILIYSTYLESILSSENFSQVGEKNLSKSLGKLLAESSVSLYNNIKLNFLPDENRHYIFTPRDISTLCINLLRYEVKSQEEIIEAWVYESCRVFRDKLVSKEHRTKFDKFLLNEISSKLKISKFDYSKVTNLIFSSLISTPNMTLQGTMNMTRIEKEDYIEQLTKGKMIYERDNAELNIYYFDEIINSMKGIDRLLSKNNSNLLLIGSNSIGRKKAVKIIASARNFEIMSLSLTKDTTIKEFKKFIKEIFQLTGVEGRNTIFLIEEHHMTRGGFMEYVNSLLSSGEVPGLLSHEEIEALISNLVSEYKEQNEYRSLYEFFVSRIRKFLKLVLILDHDNKEFNTYLLNNPAIVTKCSVMWFSDFSNSDETLRRFCNEELKEIFEQLIKNKVISNTGQEEKIVNMLIKIHQSSVQSNLNSTHAKFIELLLMFKKLISEKLSNSSSASSHLQSGLNKLVEAEKFVEELSIKSKNQKQEIEVKSKEANLSLEKIQEAMSLSTDKKSQLEKLSKMIEEESIIVEQNKSKVQEELKDVLPEVEKAKNLVKSLDSAALAEIRAYFKQPVLKAEVYNVLKAMLQLIGYSDLTSEGVKSTFNMEAISSLKSFDVKKLTLENCKKIMAIQTSNPNCFEKSYISRVNYSLAQIAEYINAIVRFYYAKENIKPLEMALEDAESKLTKSKKIQEQNANDLAKIDKQIQEYKDNFAKKMGEAELLKIEFNKTEELLNKARSLLSKLTGEKIRWQNQIDELKIQNEMIPYNCLYASAFVTYLGFYNESIREKMSLLWREIILEQNNSLNSSLIPINKFLLTESETLRLKSQGLPTDDLSLQNAIIIQNAIKTALIIDPVTKATEWFKKYTTSKNLTFDVVSLQDSKLLTNIELAIRFGKILLITDVDTIDPFLVPLIRKEYSKRGPTSVVKLGEKLIDLHDKFKLFLSTRDSSIEISENILSSLSVVNFTVTKSGLEALLLGLTIDIEQPELEKKKNELLEEQDSIKLQLSEVEKKLLEELIHLEGNLLENKALIESLEASKEKSMKSEESLKNSLTLTEEIDNKRNIYKPLSQLATVIYILLQDLYKVNPMYQFSLQNFIQIFKKTIKENQQGEFRSIEQKLNLFKNKLIETSYLYYSRSIFKSDHLVFGLFYIKSIFSTTEHEENINNDESKLEWDFLLGAISPISNDNIKTPNWLSEERKEIYSIYASTFPRIFNQLKIAESKHWEEWYGLPNPEEVLKNILIKNLQMINNSNTSLSLQCMLLIQVFRPDRLESAMRNFICETLNIKTINPPSISLQTLLEENDNNKIPILFVTTLGSDPSRELEDFATEKVGRENYIEIPLGAGDNEKIISNLKEASSKGYWICLKNLHLSISWLGALEKEIKNLKDPHPRFRIFLTSEPHNKFSTVLLQTCAKVTYETPPGVKKNLERIYQIWSNSLFKEKETQISNNPIIYQSLFSLAFIHAILQERRTYIPQGWSKFYEFSYADLKVSAETIIDYLGGQNHNNNENIWKNIRGLVINSYYGGRIDNPFDFNVMFTYINKLLNPKLLSDSQSKLLNKIPILNSSDLNSYIELIQKIPDIDDPSLFGLPLNVDRSVQRYISTGVISKLNIIYSISSDSLKFDKIKWAEKISPLLNIWKNIYSSDYIENLVKLCNKINSTDPVNIFIKIGNTGTAQSEISAKISGLFLQGSNFDGKRLTEITSNQSF